jgi:hypothetical protein
MVEEHLTNMNIEYTKSIAGDKIVAAIPNHMVFSQDHDDHMLKRNAVLPEALKIEAVDTISGMRIDWKIKDQAIKRETKPEFNSKFLDDEMSCLRMKVTPGCLRKAYGLEESSGPATGNKQMIIVNE